MLFRSALATKRWACGPFCACCPARHAVGVSFPRRLGNTKYSPAPYPECLHIVEGAGSSVTFELEGRKMTLHRPHPGNEALRYRVLAVREFIEKMGIKP